MMSFNSPAPSSNGTYLANWLSAVGITAAEVEHFEDFEAGFANGQNISDVGGLLPGQLVIRDTGSGTASAIIRPSGYYGGSNPIGTYAVSHDEQAYLELDFSARPVDYISFYDIDHAGTGVLVTFVSGGTASTSFETTDTAGNSAEFFGLYRNDQPRITRVRLDASGDSQWGIDNLRYGIVPEPASMGLLAVGALAMIRRKRR